MTRIERINTDYSSGGYPLSNAVSAKIRLISVIRVLLNKKLVAEMPH